jgi:hypothetical protein
MITEATSKGIRETACKLSLKGGQFLNLQNKLRSNHSIPLHAHVQYRAYACVGLSGLSIAISKDRAIAIYFWPDCVRTLK